MRSFWSDPYLWVHLAGLAVVPILLDFCLLGLAAGESTLPPTAELGIVAVVGVIPVLWMQWRSPFYIFSLLAIALRPTRLSEDQRRILRQFKTPLVKILTMLAAGILVFLLWQLYQLAPIAAVNSPWHEDSRWVGLAVAAIAFLGANLFCQVPASVVAVLMTSKRAFASVKPYPTEAVFQDFTVLGLPVRQVLPLPERLVSVPAPASPQQDAESPKSEPDTTPDEAADEVPTDGVVVLPATEVTEVTGATEVTEAAEVTEATEVGGDRDTQATSGDAQEADAQEADAQEADTEEALDDVIDSELGELSDTLTDALSQPSTSNGASESPYVEPPNSSPLREPPSYEDPDD